VTYAEALGLGSLIAFALYGLFRLVYDAAKRRFP
jgi:hypothetical protein